MPIPCIHLPASKSISNRLLMLNALSYSPYPIKNLSECDDTQTLLNILESNGRHFDTKGAGTAMRFLTAFLAKTVGEWTLTGNERMKQRPIKVLVDALNQIGGKIEYIGQEGYPPLRIYGSALQGGTLQIDGSISSQYTSALMMVAPYMEQGLRIELTGEIVSKSYITMTQALMRQFGVSAHIHWPTIDIRPQTYRPTAYTVENDWSAASFWYSWLAVKENGSLYLPYLYKNSLQGDSCIAPLFERLGVRTQYKKDGIVITATGHHTSKKLVYNFINSPDIVPTTAVACCLLDIPFEFSGIQTLRIKETDRTDALITESGKLGYCLTETNEGHLIWDGQQTEPQIGTGIHTHDDHRMAMAFAPALLRFPNLAIQPKNVVSKSYPHFWEELKKAMEQPDLHQPQ